MAKGRGKTPRAGASLLEQAKSRLKQRSRRAYTTAEMMAAGLSPRMLNYLTGRGEIVRISHGLYTFPEHQTIDFTGLIEEKLLLAPKGIVGLKTALRLHDLTDETPARIDIIVPRTRFPQRKLEDVRFYRVRDALHDVEITKINGIPVTKLERTLVDLLRVGEPISLVLETIRTAKAKRKKVSLSLLEKLGGLFRVKHKVQRCLEALI